VKLQQVERVLVVVSRGDDGGADCDGGCWQPSDGGDWRRRFCAGSHASLVKGLKIASSYRWQYQKSCVCPILNNVGPSGNNTGEVGAGRYRREMCPSRPAHLTFYTCCRGGGGGVSHAWPARFAIDPLRGGGGVAGRQGERGSRW
jgi:hypothetical protein